MMEIELAWREVEWNIRKKKIESRRIEMTTKMFRRMGRAKHSLRFVLRTHSWDQAKWSASELSA